jgi:hypothetical protein
MSKVKRFQTIIKHSKNKTEFYDEFSFLKLGKILKDMGHTSEIIPSKEEPQPDVKADTWGK